MKCAQLGLWNEVECRQEIMAKKSRDLKQTVVNSINVAVAKIKLNNYDCWFQIET